MMRWTARQRAQLGALADGVLISTIEVHEMRLRLSAELAIFAAQPRPWRCGVHPCNADRVNATELASSASVRRSRPGASEKASQIIVRLCQLDLDLRSTERPARHIVEPPCPAAGPTTRPAAYRHANHITSMAEHDLA